MTKLSAALAAAVKFACAMAALSVLAQAAPARAEWNAPWKGEDKALVIDAYEFNPINWTDLTSDKRISGFINKASDGLPPEWNCGPESASDFKLCKNRWWKYSVTKELFMTRREMAKMKGLLWGAYHLGRPGNPREQADHFVDFAEPGPDDLIALDIEDNTSEWMSLSDAEIFADQVKIRTGRYPVLYTNGSTAKYISERREAYPLLSRLPLWYARYREDISGKFPTETWPTYALWQFSSMHNCSRSSCPYRVKGAQADIDVNVASLDAAGLKAAWPFDKLIERPAEDPNALVASLGAETKAAVAQIAEPAKAATKAAPAQNHDEALLAAYGPAGRHPVDPLKLLTDVAREEHRPAAVAPGAGAALAPTALAPEAMEQFASRWSSFAQAIESAKSGIGRFLVAPAEAAIPPQGPAPAIGAQTSILPLEGAARSRFLDLLREARGAPTAFGPAMTPDVLARAILAGGSRGGRVVLAQTANGPLAPERRLAEAFAATR
ncbi:glycoside hydrolase family 25 protein [Aurantimonas sp. Leaf443]|uniref:glycoside hydrolase family 25 protein n=1 Tax=Aurantimonas sp. Leaf443 TaxID=1736378 RepID=UPI000B2E32F9|nr:glycoside hydrolase family 25 protein [Aurantimonas sp. Leaf443]